MLSTINVISHLCHENALKAYKDSLKLPLLSNFLQGDTVKLWGQQMKLSYRTTEKLRKWQGPGSCWARIDMEILLRMFQARLKIVECRSISIWITWYNIFIIYILYIRYDWYNISHVRWLEVARWFHAVRGELDGLWYQNRNSRISTCGIPAGCWPRGFANGSTIRVVQCFLVIWGPRQVLDNS